MGTMDGIIDTVSAVHPLVPFIGLLKSQGKLVVVGAPNSPLELHVFPLLMGKYFMSPLVIIFFCKKKKTNKIYLYSSFLDEEST